MAYTDLVLLTLLVPKVADLDAHPPMTASQLSRNVTFRRVMSCVMVLLSIGMVAVSLTGIWVQWETDVVNTGNLVRA